MAIRADKHGSGLTASGAPVDVGIMERRGSDCAGRSYCRACNTCRRVHRSANRPFSLHAISPGSVLGVCRD
jgi:hypothetical protein